MNPTRLTPEQYPFLLRQIQRPPPFLDCIGPIPPDDYKYLCVIGARQYSDYGKEACQKLIAGLKSYPVVIVSGLALGIDSIAHEAALDAGLKTVAFPGSGLSRESLYPRTHLKLAERIIKSGGTLLSPFEQWQSGDPWLFPVRNQLMAGMSHATLVIEGRVKSGTLLTAANALEFGRDVLIVPGSIFSDLSYGPHKLYRDGATPVVTSGEILESLGFDINPAEHDNKTIKMDFNSSPLSEEEKKIIRELQMSPLSATDLIYKTSLSSSRFNILVSQLELSGVIVQTNGIYKIS